MILVTDVFWSNNVPIVNNLNHNERTSKNFCYAIEEGVSAAEIKISGSSPNNNQLMGNRVLC